MPKKVRKSTLKKAAKIRDVKPLKQGSVTSPKAACWI